MLAISNWTKNGLSHQTETKTEARKSYNERKTDRPEPLSDLNHQRIGGDRQTGIPHPLILRCCLFRTFFLAFEFLMLLLSVFLFKIKYTYIHTNDLRFVFDIILWLYLQKMTEGQPN